VHLVCLLLCDDTKYPDVINYVGTRLRIKVNGNGLVFVNDRNEAVKPAKGKIDKTDRVTDRYARAMNSELWQRVSQEAQKFGGDQSAKFIEKKGSMCDRF